MNNKGLLAVWLFILFSAPLITDGKHDKDFTTEYLVVDRSGSIEVKMLRRGGFAVSLIPLQ